MSKSLSSSVAPGFAARVVSIIIRTVSTRPSFWHSRVMPFGSLAKTGMITTSLRTSHVSMSPAKSVTSRVIRARWTASTSSTGRSTSHGAVSVCQHSGWPLTETPRSTNQRAAARSRAVSGRPRSGSKRAQ